MPSCAVYGCNNYNQITKGTTIRYFKFPKNEDFLKQWLVACGRKDKLNLKNACVCSIHFEPSCFVTSLKQQLLNYTPKTRNLKPDAIPTLELPVKKRFLTDSEKSNQLSKNDNSLENNTGIANIKSETNSSSKNLSFFETIFTNKDNSLEDNTGIANIKNETDQYQDTDNKILSLEEKIVALEKNTDNKVLLLEKKIAAFEKNTDNKILLLEEKIATLQRDTIYVFCK